MIKNPAPALSTVAYFVRRCLNKVGGKIDNEVGAAANLIIQNFNHGKVKKVNHCRIARTQG
jgi:hypothetical protein